MSVRSSFMFLFATATLLACESRRSQEDLATRNCSTCHLFPDPGLLDKKTWANSIFPEMALRMGRDLSRLPATTPGELAEILKSLPPTPMVSDEDWQSIRAYFVDAAPDSLAPIRNVETRPLRQFTVSSRQLPMAKKNRVTLIRRNPLDGNIFIGTRRSKMYVLDRTLAIADSFQLQSPPSDILFHAGEAPMVSCMGIMDPNDQPAGMVIRLKKKPSVLIDSLKRPVHLERGDLNQDGQEDLLVSAFGNFTGGLYAYEKKEGHYIPHVIHHFPGTRKTVMADMNDDGLPDILALITQGDEQLALFSNRGNFRFSYQILLKFPPVYGSSYFELVDFNNDGKKDILYTNGDNADYSPILKPYHGVRIFLNDGSNHFRQSWYYPMYGASMTKAIDFDEDGDCDIAVISFFPDFKKHPEQGFIYFENDAGILTPYATALGATSRWITLETADIDHDDDVDLLLGALAFPSGVPDSLYQAWMQQQVSLLVLTNNLHSH